MTKQTGEDTLMSVQEHVRELMRRVVTVALVWLAAALAVYFRSEGVVGYFTQAAAGQGWALISWSPSAGMLQQLKFSGIAALVITLPFAALSATAYVIPGYSRVKAALATALAFTAMLGGIGFAHWVLFPFTMNFLVGINQSLGVASTIGIANYFGFVYTIYGAMGTLAELPIVVGVLTRAGLVSHRMLRKGHALAVICIFTIAAVITPPDVVSQVTVGIPVLGLYEISILVSYLMRQR